MEHTTTKNKLFDLNVIYPPHFVSLTQSPDHLTLGKNFIM